MEPEKGLNIDGIIIHEVVCYRSLSDCWEIIDNQGRTLYIYPSYLDEDKWCFAQDSLALLAK